MNILHVISAPAAGGAEIYVKDLAKELVRLGHILHIGFLERAQDIGRSVDFETTFLQELEEAGVRYFFIGHISRRMPWQGALRIRQYVRRNAIDVYHSHLTYGIIFGSLLRIPRVYTHHNARMRISRLFFALLGSAIDVLVGISDVCTKTLSAHSGRNVVTIFNGVASEKFDRTMLAPRHVSKIVRCVSVGRICEQKNLSLLVKAIALLQKDVRFSLVVDIAGEGSESDTEALKKQIVDLALEDTIRLLGNVEDVPSLLARSDLLLMSSAYEGLPIVLIEAAMSGLPCVVTDAGGCREVIEVCQNGIVVELDNPQKMAEAIATILTEPGLFERCSTSALSKSSALSIVNSANAHVEMYKKYYA